LQSIEIPPGVTFIDSSAFLATPVAREVREKTEKVEKEARDFIDRSVPNPENPGGSSRHALTWVGNV
jgi:hypothetical protein